MGKHGNEFLEFELRDDGLLKYANNSSYRKDSIIKKQLRLSAPVLTEIKRLIIQQRVLDCDDTTWPEPDRNGRQELEIRVGNTHISLVTNKTTIMQEIETSKDPAGLGAFFYFVKDVRNLILSLIGLHFKIKSVPT